MENLKNVFKPIIFVLILFLILLGMSKWFVPKSNVKGNGIIEARANGVFGEEKNTIDVLVIGDSESFTSISPLPIWKKYGFTMYNGGVSRQYLVDTYDYLNKVLEYQSPKVVLLEANAIYRNIKINNIITTKSQNMLPILKYHDRWKKMNGRDLSDRLLYTGMIRDARKLAFKDKMATAEELALMSEPEICDLIERDYNIIMSEDEKVLLIPKDKMDEFEKMAVYLCR